MTELVWTMLHPKMTLAKLGEILGWLDSNDPRPAREQLDEGYKFAGGWRPMKHDGLKLTKSNAILYPGDPPYQPLAFTMLREEMIVFYYPGEFVAIIQPDRSFEFCRMD